MSDSHIGLRHQILKQSPNSSTLLRITKSISKCITLPSLPLFLQHLPSPWLHQPQAGINTIRFQGLHRHFTSPQPITSLPIRTRSSIPLAHLYPVSQAPLDTSTMVSTQSSMLSAMYVSFPHHRIINTKCKYLEYHSFGRKRTISVASFDSNSYSPSQQRIRRPTTHRYSERCRR